MANFWYNESLRAMAEGELDFVSDDTRVALVMTNTTADTEKDKNLFSGFTTLDEMDGSPYTRQVVSLSVDEKVAPTNRLDLEAAADSVFTSLGAGTRQVEGALFHKHNATPGLEIPLAYFDSGGFPFTATGSTVTIEWNVNGVLQLQA